jgi:hypothetical protein
MALAGRPTWRGQHDAEVAKKIMWWWVKQSQAARDIERLRNTLHGKGVIGVSHYC